VYFEPGSEPFDGAVFMPNRSIGGADATGGVGFSNSGLYATTCGRVVEEPYSDGHGNIWYEIEDGSGTPVQCCDLAYDGYLYPQPHAGDYVSVTGPIQLKKEGVDFGRLMITAQKGDLNYD